MEKRKHKINSDFGVGDYFKHYKENAEIPLDRKTYSKVLKDILSELIDSVINEGYTLKLPYNMGTIMLLKRKPKVEFESGELKTDKPIDYKETLEMWKLNPEAKEQRKYIYHDNDHSNGYVFLLSYVKRGAIFKNKKYYWMQMNRGKKRLLCKKIKEGNIDALLKD